MKTLLDIVRQACQIVDTTERYFLLGSNVSNEDEGIIFPRISLGQQVHRIKAAKTARGLSQITKDVGIIVLLHTEADNVIEESDDFAEIVDGKIIEILNGYYLIKKYGSDCDLEEINLKGAQLEGANLQNANLTNANLAGADLKNANLRGANLTQTELYGANLQRCNLQEANFDCSDLRRANLTEADLRKSRFDKVALRGAEFWSAYIWDLNLSTCFLEGVDLSRGDTRGAITTVV